MAGQTRGKRGVVLTNQGWERLQKVQQDWENQKNLGVPYTIEALSELTQLDPATVSKVLHREIGVDRRTLERYFRIFALELCKADYTKPDDDTKPDIVSEKYQEVNHYRQNRLSWGEAPDVSLFYGRNRELDVLKKWIVDDRCRLITLFGIGGIGKTTLSVKIVQNLTEDFDFLVWLSLRNAPPPLEVVANIVQFLSNGEETDLPKNITQRINYLLKYLQNKRCLLVFDNIEAIFHGGNYAGNYLEGYEGYGEIFQRIGEISHQSCLLITSREKPKEIAAMEGSQLPVRSLQLNGLDILAIKNIFQTKGVSVNTDSDVCKLIINYGGNPLYLKIIATTALDLFNGKISEFVAQGISIYGDVRNLIKQQFNRLSDLEKSLLYWLAINREPIELMELKEDLLSPLSQYEIIEVLESLYRRSLIEKKNNSFTLQPAIMEYVTVDFTERVSQEIVSKQISLFQSHGLIKATAPDYIQKIQIRFVLTPVIENLQMLLGSVSQIEAHLQNIINDFRNKSPYCTGYVAGNIINLLSQLLTKINNQEFSNLKILQANLQNCNLNNVDFTNSHFAKSVFTNTFDIIFSLAFSSDDELLITGSIDGILCLWKWREHQQLFQQKAHSTIIESVTFSPDCQKMASSSRDKTVKIWDVATGECIFTLNSPNTSIIKNIEFSQDGKKIFGYTESKVVSWDINTADCDILAESNSRIFSMSISSHSSILVFGCADSSIHILNVDTREIIKKIETKSGVILSVIITDDEKILASGLIDKSLKVWDITIGYCTQIIQAQSYNFSLISISQDGQILATGSGEKIIKIWDINTGNYLQSLEGHLSEINTIAFSHKNKILATGSVDRTVKLWDTTTGKCLKTLQGRTDFVHSVTFNRDAQILATGSQHEIHLWDVNSGGCITTLFDYQNWLYSLAFSPNGQMLACGNIGNGNNIIRLWLVNSLDKANPQQVPNQILQGHTDSIWSIAFSPDSKIIVSGSSDRTVKLWDSQTGQCLKTFVEHTRPILSVTFSPDGKIIASCGGHSIIKLWDVVTGECNRTIKEQASYTIAFSPNGYLLASGNTSGLVKLWDVRDGQCTGTLGRYGKPIISIAFSPDGKILACGSFDGTVNLWDTKTNQCIQTFENKIGSAWSLAFSSDATQLAVGGNQELIGLWNVNTGECTNLFKGNRPYEGMKITGVTGLTPVVIANAKALGARG